MAAKVDLTTSTDWKEAKTYLKGLNQKQRREHYYTKDFVTLKDIDTWKKMAKSARLKQPEETKFPKDNHLNEKISLVRRDITKLEMDAIVNAVPWCGGRAEKGWESGHLGFIVEVTAQTLTKIKAPTVCQSQEWNPGVLTPSPSLL
ncbi:MACRO domain-containing protein 1 [Chelonia mydas]|uniref:MACRO domain-containing protein 1 n=1 Tax=Chelonia mydas TaxID=8469 RepID=M7ASB2_CHEMY|nr:MACRO domain-containing protein 1 [Chelonia mydas]